MWQTALGIQVKFVDEDFNKLITDITNATNNPKGISMWGLGCGSDYPDAQDFTTLQFDKGSQQNNMNYGQNSSANSAAQKTVQQQLEAADINTANPTQRIQQYNTLEQQLINDVAWIPEFQQEAQGLRKPCVVGYQEFSQWSSISSGMGKRLHFYKFKLLECTNSITLRGCAKASPVRVCLY